MKEVSRYIFEMTISGEGPLDEHNITNRILSAVSDRLHELQVIKVEQKGKNILLLNISDEVAESVR